MDNLFEQAANISKAGAYNALLPKIKELESENAALKIKLKGAEDRIEALKHFINEIRPDDSRSVELARTDTDDLKDINI